MNARPDNDTVIEWRGNHDHCAHEHTLEVKGLCVNYGPIEALREISFRTSCGSNLALVGPNGAGKSTLLKALAGLVARECGDILWRGEPAAKHSREVAYLPQREAVDWDFPVTVRGMVEMGRYPQVGWWRRFSARDADVVETALGAMELQDLSGRQISALSGGQQQRAFIARALAQEAHVLLLDEPFTGLDRPAQTRLIRLLRELTAEGRLIVASHHDLGTVREIYDEVLLLDAERVAFGTLDEAFTPENLKKTYGSGFFWNGEGEE